MALEAVVFPQDLFGHNTSRDWFSIANGELLQNTGNEIDDIFYNGSIWPEPSCSASVQNFGDSNYMQQSLSPAEALSNAAAAAAAAIPTPETAADSTTAAAAAGRRRKRRRLAKCAKNREEMESQRMTHIAVERNRRKQMNDYLAVLRSLMPPSYVQRGDQASIVGGAINYVKELEQLLQSLEVQKRLNQQQADQAAWSSDNGGSTGQSSPAKADVEVTMAESHAIVKVLAAGRRPNQLLKLILGLQSLRLTPLHLNVTAAVDQTATLYYFSLKVEDDCLHNSMEDIAAAVNQILGRIQEETVLPHDNC